MSLTQTELARALGVDAAVISRDKRRGMPTDSIEAARAWRARTLRPRMRNMPTHRPPPPAPPRSAACAAAEALARHAGDVLAAGGAIADLVPSLRAALHAVPDTERPALALPVPVIYALAADVLAVVRTETPDTAPGELTDDDAQELGKFWFSVCAGEIRPA